MSEIEKTLEVDKEMDKMNYKYGKMLHSIGIGLVATGCAVSDYLIVHFILRNQLSNALPNISFTWIAFISWTMFASAHKMDRIKALIGFIVGFLAANLMIFAGFNISKIFPAGFVPVGAFIVTFLFNTLFARYGYSPKIFNSVPATFLGMSLTFSGMGINESPFHPIKLAIIVIYGIMGLICCFTCDLLAKKFLKQ